MDGTLYQIVTSTKPEGGLESFTTSLHSLLLPFQERVRQGQPHITLEMHGTNGAVRFFLWIPDGLERAVEAYLRAAYPGAAITPAEEDPLAFTTHGYEAVGTYALFRQQFLPIRTAMPEGVPIDALLHALAAAEDDQRFSVQLLVRPRSNFWQVKARRGAQRLRRGKQQGTVAELSEFVMGPEQPRSASHLQLEQAVGMEWKADKLGFDCALRIACRADSAEEARMFQKIVEGALKPFTGLNGFKSLRFKNRAELLGAIRERTFRKRRCFILNATELATCWSIPKTDAAPVQRLHVPAIRPPKNAEHDQRIIGDTSYPGHREPVGIKLEDARQHLHVIGGTGTGKTTLLVNLALQDIHAGRSVIFLDPKQDAFDAILERLPRERLDDVIVIEPAEDWSTSFNPLRANSGHGELAGEQLLAIFRKFYAEYWGIYTEDVMRSALLTLLQEPNATVCHLPLLLENADYRRSVLKSVNDPLGLEPFWTWYEWLPEAKRTGMIGPTLNKLRDILLRPKVRRTLCQPHHTIDLNEIVNGNKILLVNLAPGLWGEDSAALIGSFLFSDVWDAIRLRANVPEEERSDVHMYIDEFPTFVSASASTFEDILAQARSLRLSLTLAHQHIDQLDKDMRSAVDANARNKIVFQLGQTDAVYMAPRLRRPISSESLMSLARHEIVAQLVLDGHVTQPFVAHTRPVPPITDPTIRDDAIAASRAKYGTRGSDADEQLIQDLDTGKAVLPLPSGTTVLAPGRRVKAHTP